MSELNEPLPLIDYAEATIETRKAAFLASKPKLNSRCSIVLEFIRRRGSHGATMAETSAATGILYQSVSSPFGTLRKERLIRPNGQKRPTPTGSPAAVLVAADYAGPDAVTEGAGDATA